MTNEAKEMIYKSYEKTLDLDLAFKKLMVSEEEQETLRSDKEFQARLAYAEACKKEQLLENLFVLSISAKTDNVKLQALLEIMKTYYPERFGKDKDKQEETEKVVIYLPENNRGNKA